MLETEPQELETQMSDIRITMQQARASVDRGESLKRLMKNADFKKIITDGYLNENAVRLVHLTTDPAWKEDKNQEALREMMVGVSSLEQHFRFILQHAENSAQALREGNEQLEELEQIEQEQREEMAEA